MGGKRRAVRAVDELIELLARGVEADVERCLRRGYALIIGDDCVLSALKLSGVGEDEVSFLSYPGVAVVKKGSPQYARIAGYVGGVAGGRSRDFDIVFAWGEGAWCSYETYGVAEGAEGEIARELARPLVGITIRDIADKVGELMEDGVCRGEAECLKYMLEHSTVDESVCE
jgi:hypothetical protein